MTSQSPARRRPAPRAAAAVAAASLLLLPACSFAAPNTAIQPYAPADGLQTELGEVLVRNMLVVSDGDGEPGLLIGALINRGQEDVLVQLEVSGTELEVELPPGVSLALGQERVRPDDEAATIVSERVEIDEVEVIAGDVTELTVTAPAGGEVLRVPVERPEGDYAEFDPSS